MSIRIIGGRFKRQVLSVPKGQSTRPTASRVREALFSILGDLTDARVLDLYAGSGALGVEALSRGAAYAVFVERERAALACIGKNLTALGLDTQATVIGQAAERVAKARWSASGPFDLVFCDPPWADLEAALRVVTGLAPHLAANASVVLEHPSRHAPMLPRFERTDVRGWGDTGISFFRPSSGVDSAPLEGDDAKV